MTKWGDQMPLCLGCIRSGENEEHETHERRPPPLPTELPSFRYLIGRKRRHTGDTRKTTQRSSHRLLKSILWKEKMQSFMPIVPTPSKLLKEKIVKDTGHGPVM
jgi:hypothetical protein